MKRFAAPSIRRQRHIRKWLAESAARRARAARNAGHARSRNERISLRLRTIRLSSRCRLLRATRVAIGQPLPCGAFDGLGGAFFVRHAERDPFVVAEIEFGEIPLQMLLADVVLDAITAA